MIACWGSGYAAGSSGSQEAAIKATSRNTAPVTAKVHLSPRAITTQAPIIGATALEAETIELSSP